MVVSREQFRLWEHWFEKHFFCCIFATKVKIDNENFKSLRDRAHSEPGLLCLQYPLYSIAKNLRWRTTVLLNLEPKARIVALCADRVISHTIPNISSITDSAAKWTAIVGTNRPHGSNGFRYRNTDSKYHMTLSNNKPCHCISAFPTYIFTDKASGSWIGGLGGRGEMLWPNK